MNTMINGSPLVSGLFDTTSEDYTEKCITKSLKLVASNLKLASTSAVKVIHHRKGIQIQNNVWRHIHFFIVQNINKDCPMIEADTLLHAPSIVL